MDAKRRASPKNRKTTPEMIEEWKKLKREGKTYKAIAAMFDVSFGLVQRKVCGE